MESKKISESKSPELQKQLENKLCERIKELECIQQLSNLAEKHENIDDILSELVDILKQSWQFPELTEVRITNKTFSYQTDNYRETQWKMVAEIQSGNKIAGKIEIVYLENPTELSDPFLKEEYNLLQIITERLGKIIERLEKTKRYEELFNTLYEAILKADKDGVITEANQTAAQLCGYESPEDLIGSPMTDLYSNPKVRADILEELNSKGGAFHSFEFPLKTKDGNIVPVLCNIRMLYNRNGNFVGTLGALRDISDRKKAEQALKESENDLYFLNNMTKEALEMQNIKSIYDYISSSLQKLLPNTIVLFLSADEANNNCRLENIYGINNRILKKTLTIPGFNPVGKIYNIIPSIYEIHKTGKLVEFKNGLVDFSVDEFPAFAAKSIESIIGLHKIYTIGISKDNKLFAYLHFLTFNKQELSNVEFIEAFVKQAGLILQIKQAEQALKESEEKFRQLFEGANDAIFLADTETGKIIDANKQAEKLLGRKTSEIIGMHQSQLHPPVEENKAKTSFKEDISLGDTTVMKNFHVLHKNGHKIPVEISPSIIEINGKKYVLGTFRDITDRKKAEENLLKSNTILQEAEYLSNIGSFELNIPEKTMTLSEGWRRIHGTNKSVLKMDELMEFAYPDDTEKINLAFDNALNNKKPYNIEHRIIRQDDNEVRLIKARGKAIFDENGSPLKMYGSAVDITDLKIAEQALKESEERFKLAMDATNDGIWDWDIIKKTVYYNHAWFNILGLSDFDYSFQTWENRIHEEDKNEVIRLLNNHLEGKTEIWQKEHRLLTEDGNIIWVLGRGKVVKRKPDGTPHRMVGTMTDITDRKKAEQALKDGEAKLKALVNNAADGLLIFSPQNGVEYVSPSYLKITGYSEAEEYNKTEQNLGDFIHPEDRATTLQAIYNAITNKETYLEYVFRWLHKNGHYFWRKDKITFEYDDKGQYLKSYMVCSDITKEIEAKNALKESEEKFRNIFELSQTMIGIADVNTATFKMINPAFSNLLGYAQEELLSKSFLNFVHPDDKEATIQVIEKKLKAGEKVFHFVNRYLCKDKKYKWIDWNAYSHIQDDLLYAVGNDITEIENNKEELAKQNTIFQTLLDNLSQGVFMVEAPGGKPILANEAARRILGRGILPDANKENLSTVYKAYKESTGESYPPEEMPIIKGMYGKKSYIDDMIVETDTGIRRNLEIFGTPVYNSEGKVWASIASFADITDRKKAEQAIKESEEKLSLILNSFTEPVYHVSSDFKLLFANQVAKNKFGDNMVGKKCYESIYNKKEKCSWCVFPKLNIESKVIEYDYYSDKEDKYRTVTNILLDDKSKLSIYHNVTDIKKAEQTLKEITERLKDAQKLAKIGHWNWQLNTNELIWSDETYQIYGQNPESFDVTFENVEKTIHPDDIDRLRAERENAIKEKRGLDTKHRIVLPDGSIRWVREIAKKQANENDNTGTVIMGTVQDITDFVLIEQKLKKQADKLDQLNKDKDQFISVLAHDIKNPFNSLLGFSELLNKNIDKYDKEKIKKQAGYINDLVNKTYKLLEDTLLWSRTQSDAYNLKFQQINVSDLLKNELEVLNSQADSKKIKIINNIQKDTLIKTDAHFLKTVFRNLISNAIKFTHNEGSVTVDATEKEDNIEFSIADTGVGMEQEDIDTLFQIKHIRTTEGTQNEKGTGFGLKICKQLLEKIGGTIWVESEVGHGSVFYFTIPVINSEIDKSIDGEKDIILKNTKFKILIAEDEEVNFMFLEELINEEIALNCEIVHVVNGKEAIEYAKKSNFDLILMDIKMPIMDGFEATLQIKQLKPETKIIIQSANSEQKHIDKATALGCNDFLTKPLTSEVLKASIYRHLSIHNDDD